MSVPTIFYILKDGEPEAVSWPWQDRFRWSEWMLNQDQHVAETILPSGVRVSTVFTGINYNRSHEGQPVLWETMVFGGPMDMASWRYTSEEAARKGHNMVVELNTRNVGASEKDVSDSDSLYTQL